LNDGRPVWHASVSAWTTDQRRKLAKPRAAEREGVRLLAGVGGQDEWWVYSPAVRVGHLRVAVTEDENAAIPPACVIADAGPRRHRTPHR